VNRVTQNISLTQLVYILALEEKKHFGLAAKKCGISQPTLSMQIQKLEDELGVMLFDRSKQPIVPTATGMKVIQQARLALREVRQIEEILLQEKGEVSGEFRLGIIPTLAPYLLPLFLADFSKKYPKVSLSLQELETQQITEKLKKDELDAGLLVTPLLDEAIQETPLFYEPFWAYVADSHRLAKVKLIKGNELPLDEIWLLKEGHCFRDQVIQLCGRRRSNPEKTYSLRFESGNLGVLKSLVDQGIGLTLLPDLAIRTLTTREEKARVKLISDPRPVREVSLVQIRAFHKKRVVDALMQMILKAVPRSLLQKQTQHVVGL